MISSSSNQRSNTDPDRGLSEVLSFVFVSTLVLATLSITFIVGIDNLEERQEQEKISNIERSLVIYDENVNDLIEGSARVRTTQLQTQDATLGGGYETSMSIELDNANETYASNSTVFRYETEYNVEYVQEFGAILKIVNPSSNEPEVIMLHKPQFVFTDEFDSVSLHMVETRQSNSNVTIQTDRILVRKSTGRNVVISPGGGTVPEDITVTMNTPNYEFWNEYMSSKKDVDSCTTNPSQQKVTCELTGVEDYSIAYTAITYEYKAV